MLYMLGCFAILLIEIGASRCVFRQTFLLDSLKPAWSKPCMDMIWLLHLFFILADLERCDIHRREFLRILISLVNGCARTGGFKNGSLVTEQSDFDRVPG